MILTIIIALLLGRDVGDELNDWRDNIIDILDKLFPNKSKI